MQLDPSTIAVTGARTAAAGAAYALQQRAHVATVDLVAGVVRGSCRGSGSSTYSTTTVIEHDRHGEIRYSSGQCSCPVGIDCKHSVALYLAAFGSIEPDPIPFPKRPALHLVGEPPPQPSWERTLGRIFTEVPRVETVPLALAFELPPPPRKSRWVSMPGAGPALRIRPLRRGKRDNWIQTGADWTAFFAVSHEFPPDQARAMQALTLAISGSSAGYLSTTNGWATLDRLTNALPWELIRALRDAGVALVEPKRGGAEVVLHDEPGEAEIDVLDRGGDIELGARFRLPYGVQLDGVTPIGTTPIGVVGRDGEGTLTIVGFRHAAQHEWRLLHEAGGARVPAADRERFERTTLPRITNRTGWRSSDGSYVVAPPAPPVLEIQVDVGNDLRSPEAMVAIGWRYGPSSSGLRLPLRPAPFETAIRNDDAESMTLARVTAVLETLPPLLDEGRPLARARVTGLDVAALTSAVLPALAALDGVEIRVPDDLPEFRDLGDPEIRLSVAQGTDWFDLDVTVTVDGVAIPIALLILALTAGTETLFLEDGGYLTLDRPELQRLRELLEEARALAEQQRSGPLRVSRLQISWWNELLALGVVEEQERTWIDALRLAVESADTALALPEGLQAELRPYQRDGYEWLARLRRAGLGGVLADDMGLGKTLQSLAMMLDARREAPESGPFIVVAPTSVVPNWVAEAARFTPSLRVAQITQTGGKRGNPLTETAADADVVVTSYALFQLEYEEYAALAPSGLILDEAQNAKNHQSKAFACAKQLPAPVKFAVTGTPMENNLGELWAMFSIVAPGLLGNPRQFTDHYRNPIERGAEADLLPRLRRRISPFLLRRTKQEVATDLPSKQEQRIDVELAPSHRRVYARQLQHERQRVLGLVDDLDRNRIEVLSALTRLRQIAIDPALGTTDGGEGASSKLDVLVPLLEEATAEGHRTLVFSQFTRFLDRIEGRLRKAGIEFVRLDGRTRRRAEVVQSFAEGTQPVFLISLKAGGTGLNLAMADYCILTDPWWNPATEAQAVDRAHRIGQTRPVVVYRLIAKDTIEEKVMALQDRKRELVAGVIGGDGGGVITASDIRALLD